MNEAQQRLYAYYTHQPAASLVAQANFSSELVHPSCGDSIIINGIISNNVVQVLGYICQGCMLSQATASLLAEFFIGKSIQYVVAYTADDLQFLIGLPLGPIRFKCAYLSLQALQQGLQNYQKALVSE